MTNRIRTFLARPIFWLADELFELADWVTPNFLADTDTLRTFVDELRSEHMEKAQLENSDRIMWVHKRNATCDESCAIHNRSDHSMRSFPQHWRGDRGLMERICRHGVGHPDPDDIDFKRRTKGERFANAEASHGCDGCCRPGGHEQVQQIHSNDAILSDPRWQHQCAGCRNETTGTLDEEGLCESCTA